jgi:hypothetical protein
MWISGIALPANVAACLALVWPWQSSLATTLAMVLALCLGNVVALLVARRQQVGELVLAAIPEAADMHRGSLWFFAKAATGYAGQLVLMTLAVLLPASSVTVLSLAAKVVGALATTFTNAVMPVLVHRSTPSPRLARRFLRFLCTGLLGLSVIGTVVVAAVAPDLTVAAIVVSAWVLASSAAAVAQRTAFRFLPADAAGLVMAAVAAVVLGTTLLALLPGFDVVVLLCAYAALDAATAALLLWRLQDRKASLAASLLLGALVALAVFMTVVG